MIRLLVAVFVAAQLTPVGGNVPLPSNDGAVAPAPVAGWTHARLPAWLAPKRPVVTVRHGTEIFREPDYRVAWHTSVHDYARTMHAVAGLRRGSHAIVVETVSAEHTFPSNAVVAVIPGEYTLIFYAPGERRSPLLRYAHPDFVIP